MASIIFVFGLLSCIGHSNNDDDNKEPNLNQIKTWKFTSEDSLNKNETFSLNVDLEKTLVSKYYLGIRYGIGKIGQLNVPIYAYSTTTGFISGTNWKPLSIIVNTTTGNKKFEYLVDGIVEWKLLGATIYSQPKKYEGIILTK